MADVRGGLLFARQLQVEGVDCVFTLTGGHISALIEGCARTGIRVIDLRHEQAVAHAADAYARLTRRPAVGLVTAGPGMTDALTGIANAFYAGVPLVLVSGCNPIGLSGLGNLQDAPHAELARPVTKRVESIFDARRIPEQLSWAFTAAMSGRPGPVLVDIPIDVQLEMVDERVAGPVVGCRSTTVAHPDLTAVDEVSKLLVEAVRPVVVAGSGVYWSRAEEPLAQLAAAADLPVFVNGMARGVLSASHRSALSLTRGEALRRADLVLALGIDFDFRLGYGRSPAVNSDAIVVQVDIDPGRMGGTRQLAHGVVSDVGAWLAALLVHEPAFGMSQPRVDRRAPCFGMQTPYGSRVGFGGRLGTDPPDEVRRRDRPVLPGRDRGRRWRRRCLYG